MGKKASAYRYFETATRHDLIPHYGFGVVYFEVGNPRISLYGRFAGNYTYNDDSKATSLQQDTGYCRYMNENGRTNNPYGLGELQFKWMPSNKDFFIAHIYDKAGQKKINSDEIGYMQTLIDGNPQEKDDFTYSLVSRDKSNVLTSNLYYKHTFAPENTLETMFAYNCNTNTNTSTREEKHTLNDDYYDYFKYKNRRSSGQLDIDYSYTWNNINSFSAGSSLRYTDDKIDKMSTTDPVFYHKEVDEYLCSSIQ